MAKNIQFVPNDTYEDLYNSACSLGVWQHDPAGHTAHPLYILPDDTTDGVWISDQPFTLEEATAEEPWYGNNMATARTTIVQELAEAVGEVEDGELDVRLQVLDDGKWALHSGDAQYDTDHTGYWGATTVTRNSDLDEAAADLIAQVCEHYAQMND